MQISIFAIGFYGGGGKNYETYSVEWPNETNSLVKVVISSRNEQLWLRKTNLQIIYSDQILWWWKCTFPPHDSRCWKRLDDIRIVSCMKTGSRPFRWTGGILRCVAMLTTTYRQRRRLDTTMRSLVFSSSFNSDNKSLSMLGGHTHWHTYLNFGMIEPKTACSNLLCKGRMLPKHYAI